MTMPNGNLRQGPLGLGECRRDWQDTPVDACDCEAFAPFYALNHESNGLSKQLRDRLGSLQILCALKGLGTRSVYATCLAVNSNSLSCSWVFDDCWYDHGLHQQTLLCQWSKVLYPCHVVMGDGGVTLKMEMDGSAEAATARCQWALAWGHHAGQRKSQTSGAVLCCPGGH